MLIVGGMNTGPSMSRPRLLAVPSAQDIIICRHDGRGGPISASCYAAVICEILPKGIQGEEAWLQVFPSCP